tara:strand:- start:1807 stop:3264 length:1458 start_codon:yes stop_codon:yes gene_type:complete
MQDDKINNDDFEDIDFDDLDDEFDDLPEDDLPVEDEEDLVPEDRLDDDFDGDDFAEDDDWGDADLDAAEDDGSNNKKTKGGKSSSKMILPLLAGVALIGGGGFYVTQMQNNAAPTNFNTQNTAAPNGAPGVGMDITEDTLPMPSPMSAPVDDEFAAQDALSEPPSLADIENRDMGDMTTDNNTAAADDMTPLGSDNTDAAPQQQAGTFGDDGVLTPMPGLASIEAEPAMPLESLGLEEDADTALTEEAGEDTLPVAQDALSEPPSLADIENRDMASDDAPAAMDDSEFALGLDDASDTQPAQYGAAETAPEQIGTVANTVDVSEYEQKISTLERNLNAKTETISSLNSEIAALKKSLAQQEKKLSETQETIASLKKQQMASPAPAPKAAPKPAPAQAPAVQKAAPSQSAQAATPPPKPAIAVEEIKPKWELKSAQPGRAYVGIIGARDTQVVEVGDTLQGIGTIQSIAQQDGIWVVKGTKGSITQ